MKLPWIIVYAIVLHLVWAGALIVSSDAGFSTAPHGLVERFQGRWIVVGVLVVSSVATAWAIFQPPSVRTVLAMAPQQILLVLSAFSALDAIIGSQFPDGVIRPRAFILTDQIPAVLAALAHTAAILDWHGVRWLQREA